MPKSTEDKITLMTSKEKEAVLDFCLSKDDQHYWTLTAKNGKQIATCLPERYKQKQACINNAYDILLCKWSIER